MCTLYRRITTLYRYIKLTQSTLHFDLCVLSIHPLLLSEQLYWPEPKLFAAPQKIYIFSIFINSKFNVLSWLSIWKGQVWLVVVLLHIVIMV